MPQYKLSLKRLDGSDRAEAPLTLTPLPGLTGPGRRVSYGRWVSVSPYVGRSFGGKYTLMFPHAHTVDPWPGGHPYFQYDSVPAAFLYEGDADLPSEGTRLPPDDSPGHIPYELDEPCFMILSQIEATIGLSWWGNYVNTRPPAGIDWEFDWECVSG